MQRNLTKTIKRRYVFTALIFHIHTSTIITLKHYFSFLPNIYFQKKRPKTKKLTQKLLNDAFINYKMSFKFFPNLMATVYVEKPQNREKEIYGDDIK